MAYTLNPELIRQPVQDQLILMDPVREKYLQLNLSGMRILELLCELGSIEAVAARLPQIFEVSHDQAAIDVAKIANQLITHHILVQNA